MTGCFANQTVETGYWVNVTHPGGVLLKPEWKAQKSHVPAQQPPTQGHDRDMGTTPNTAATDAYGGVGLTHDASLLKLDLDHDQRWSGLDEARFDRHLVLVELDAGELGVAG